MYIITLPLKRLLTALGLVVIIIGLSQSVAWAEDTVTRSITVNEPVKKGELISLDGTHGRPADLTTANRLVGVTGTQGLIEISQTNEGTKVSVITGGASPTLVSDINGAIKNGDRITASPLSGIGMKATESGRVVGVALQDLSQVTHHSQTVTAKDGKVSQVQVGSITVQIGPSNYTKDDGNTSRIVPAFLQSGLAAVAGKAVSPVRSIVALAIMIIGFVLAAILLSTSIRASITAIGRNPLAGNSVRRSMWQVILTGLAIIAAGMISAYLLILV